MLRLVLLALCGMFGSIGCAKHADDRIHELRMAAEHGDADAEAHLGLEYRIGRSVPRDDVEAMKWFRKAAEHGSMLGVLLAHENPIPDSLKLILEESNRLELLSLDPTPVALAGRSKIVFTHQLPPAPTPGLEEELFPPTDVHQGPSQPGTFHGYRVLKTSVVSDTDTRKELVTAFEIGVEGGSIMDEMLCFSPRHGIRAVRSGKTADFVICFECGSVVAYLDGKSLAEFPITNYPASIFNAVLKANSDSPGK